MKIEELKKDELCELVKSLRSVEVFIFRYKIEEFLQKRWERKSKKLLDELCKVDVTKNFTKFKRINDELDELYNNAEDRKSVV